MCPGITVSEESSPRLLTWVMGGHILDVSTDVLEGT